MALLELTEDQMVEELAELQRRAREMRRVGAIRPYSEKNHERAVTAVMEILIWLARSGDVV
jgi:hypothetical protein